MNKVSPQQDDPPLQIIKGSLRPTALGSDNRRPGIRVKRLRLSQDVSWRYSVPCYLRFHGVRSIGYCTLFSG
jgi:hypothetical protein